MADLNSEDRKWLDKINSLKELRHHPAWSVYQDEVIDIILGELQEILLNGASKETFRTNDEELAYYKAVRLFSKAVVKLRNRPEELLKSAQNVRQFFGLAEPEEID